MLNNGRRLGLTARAFFSVWLAIGWYVMGAQGAEPVAQYSTTTAHDQGPLFVDPLEFDPDFQLFKPFDRSVYEYGRQPKVRRGWFFNFDRMWVQLSRPETGGSNGMAGQQLAKLIGEPFFPLDRPQPRLVNQEQGIIARLADRGDFTYANRLDLGFMSDKHQGWMISYINIQNPNEKLSNFNEQNHEIEPPEIEEEEDGGATATADEGELENVYTDLFGEPLGEFEYSINAGDLWSLELTKIFRLEPLQNGIVIEPLMGFRYINFKDFFIDKDAEFELIEVAEVDDEGVITFTPTPFLEIDTFQGRVINQMLTAQIGFRAHKQRGRWLLGWESRLFGGNNFQAFERTHHDELQSGGGGGEDGGTDEETVLEDQVDVGVEVRLEEFELSELVLGTELRFNASYYLTRDVAVNMGLEILHFGRGIGRGFDLNNNEHLTLMGATVGIVVNR